MACGLPVISTRVGNMTEIIKNGYNGFLVNRTIDDIATGIEKIKQSDIDYLSLNARSSIENGWTWKDKVKNYEK